MLKRLIIAVFGIGLVLAFGSIVLATEQPGILPNDIAVDHFIPNHPKLNAIEDARPAQPAFKKPVSARTPLPSGTPAPAPPSLIYFCDAQSYTGGLAYYWKLPDAYGDELFNTRFTVEATFECTLKVAHFLMYDPQTDGAPDFRAYLWADDGFGFPGALLDSVTIPNAAIVAAMAPAGNFTYLSADFSAAGWVFSDGDEYHYGWNTIGGPGDTLAIISDDGAGPYSGEERSSEYWSGAWGSMLNDWGLDVVFEIVSERCCNEIPFSDCYTQSYYGGVSYFWRAPHPLYGDSSWAQRFDVGGPETLSSVDIAIYGGGGSLGDEAVNITIYDDNGSGLPGAQLAQVTLPGTSYPLFPALTNVPFAPLVLENPFHVAFSSAGVPGTSWESCLSDNGTFGVGRSSASGDPTWPNVPGPWYTMLSWWGLDNNFLFKANLCRDEFANCAIQNWTGGIVDAIYPIPELNNGNTKWAQRFTNAPSGSECELRELFLHFARSAAFDGGRPNMYTYDTWISVALDAAGYPGAVIHTETLTPADYAAAGYTGSTFYGSFFITRNMNVSIPGTFWVVVESASPDRAQGIRYAMNLFTGGGGNVNGMAVYDYGVYGPPSWYYAGSEFFGTPDDGALDLTAKVCCVPYSERTCAPAGDDWSSRSHDLARTGASQLAIGDAWCDLNLNAVGFQDDLNAAASAQTMGPIIYEGRVFQILATASAGSSIRVFDLATGASEGTITLGLGNFAENDPLIVNDKLYVAGGDNRIVSRWDVSGAIPGAPDWTRTLGAAGGPLRRTNLILLNVAGTDVLFGGTQIGRAFAINESDGLDYVGWATNPITLDAGQLVQGAASDGSLLYFGTRQAGLNGDVWAIDPAVGLTAGLPVWKLSTSGGYQGLTVYASITSEAFPNVSVDAGVLYVGGRPTGSYPTDGLFYRVDAATGAVLSVAGSNGALFANPIIDVNLVYLATVTGWVTPPNDGDLFAYAKNTGAMVWADEDYFEGGADSRHFANGLLTCEPAGAPDIIVKGNVRGALSFVNSLDGTEYFRRRVDFGPGSASLIGGVALGLDNLGATHLLVGTLRGALIDLTEGAPRPRLEIQDFDPQLAVEFSVSTSVIYTVPDILTNTGCADLTFSAVNVDTTTFGPTDPLITPPVVVRPGLLDAASNLADQMASNSAKFKYPRELSVIEFSDNNNLLASSEESQRNERGYRAALVLPAYLNGVVQPFVGQIVPANDTIDLVMDVNASNIKRGPQTFYIELVTNDPDYFLNGPSVALPNAAPELIITLVGGCLNDSTTLEFGVGSANHQFVFNDGFLADPDGPYGFEIDGDNDAHWMSTYLYGVSPKRIALSIYYSGFTFISWQADPNWCDNLCKPALSTGVALGAMWNGAVYVPILGNMVCASGIDSVQNFFDGSSWDWDTPGPFDPDSTMGLSLNARTVGAVDVPALANLTVDIMEFTERNGRAVPGWKFGFWGDFDTYVNSPGTDKDTAQIDIAHSVAWSTVVSGAGSAWGMIKLPFGCGYTPLKNARLLDSDNSMYAASTGGYLDSFYVYASRPAGLAGMPGAASTRDQSLHVTIIERDIAASEKFDFAVAQFGLHNLPSTFGAVPAIQDLATLTNKWVGFGRGDVNDDDAINLGDIMVLADIVGGSVPGAIPFQHLGDVDADGDVDSFDLNYLIAYYFDCGPCPLGDWQF